MKETNPSYVVELPGCLTHGATRQEALRNAVQNL
mgnify:CR=1 FL=1